MNIYDYRTIPPEESAYHARTSHTASRSEYGDGDIPRVDLPKTEQAKDVSEPESTDLGAKPRVKDIIPDEVPRRDGPGGN